ncbi:MAG: hypothetical protein ACRD0J_00675, partial [Acidimicrobiales bacterium]
APPASAPPASAAASGEGRPPALASVASAAHGATVDGIKCATSEQLVFHIHAHLAVYVDGSARTVPGGIGIAPPRQSQPSAQGPFVVAGSCFYWLHTHAPNGVIHIESPVQRTFTLGQFFDVWHQPLGPDQVGPAKGKVTTYVNGQAYRGNPRSITLHEHTLIQLDVGQPVVSPKPYTFPPGL